MSSTDWFFVTLHQAFPVSGVSPLHPAKGAHGVCEQPSAPKSARLRQPSIRALGGRRVDGRRMMRSGVWGTISVTTVEAVEKRTVLTTPSDGCATGDACAALRRLHAIILAVAPHRIQDAPETARERHDGDPFPAPRRELVDPRV